MEDLIKKLVRHYEKLNSGELDRDGLDNFVRDAASLLEHLHILRYKGYEQKAGASGGSKKPSIHLHFEPPADEKQITLLDAIEEAKKTGGNITFTPKPSSEAKGDNAEKKKKKKEKVAPAKEPVEMVEEIPVEETPAPEPEMNVGEDPESLNEKLSKMQEEQPTVAEKLQKTPIPDLKEAIGLNEKFLFINELFQQNADIYHDSIDQLNNCRSRNQAMEIITRDFSEKYGWDIDSKSVARLIDLVERRYA